MHARSQQGQATIELALLLPVVAMFAWGLVEVGAIAVDNVRLWHAAREAVRVGAVDPDPAAIRDAAAGSGLGPLELTIRPEVHERIQGEPVTVRLIYHPSSSTPFVGSLFERITLTADATMRIERP